MGDNEWTPIACPECESHRFAITQDQPPKAKCADCGHVFDIPTLPPSEKQTKTRHSAPGSKTRRPNGPASLAVKPVPPPDPRSLGPAHLYTEAVLTGGPRALIAAQRQAEALAAKFGEQVEAEWCLTTKWLTELIATQRARVRYTLMWRPRFLAILAITGGPLLAARGAKVSINTVKAHRREDKEFDLQCVAAQEAAYDLLHDVTMRDAIEGTCKPIFWQGIPIGHVREYDNRLRIEMLRAHMPDRFKTPGAKVSVNTGNTLNLLVVDEAVQAKLVALRQEALRAIAQGRVQHVAQLPEHAVSLVDEGATTR